MPKSREGDNEFDDGSDSSDQKFYNLRYGVDQDSNISKASPDGYVGIVPLFRSKVSGLCANQNEEDKSQKSQKEKRATAQPQPCKYTYSSAAFFMCQTNMKSMREKDPLLYAKITDQMKDEREGLQCDLLN